MTIILHGAPFTPCTRSVLVALKELNIPYEIKVIDISTGEHKSPAYLEHHPFGQVPYIEDGDFELYESRAIVRYLATKYGDGKLLPIPVAGDVASVQRNAKFEQAASIEYSNFYQVASGIAIERVFKPLRGFQGNDALAAGYATKLEGTLKVYDTILSKQKYLAGDEVTFADLFHLPFGSIITDEAGFKGLVSDALPNVARWWKDITSRESWVTVGSLTLPTKI